MHFTVTIRICLRYSHINLEQKTKQNKTNKTKTNKTTKNKQIYKKLQKYKK